MVRAKVNWEGKLAINWLYIIFAVVDKDCLNMVEWGEVKWFSGVQRVTVSYSLFLLTCEFFLSIEVIAVHHMFLLYRSRRNLFNFFSMSVTDHLTPAE